MALGIGDITRKATHAIQANFILRTTFTADTAYPQTEGGYDMDALFSAIDKAPQDGIIHLHMEPFYDTGGTTGYFGVWQSATNRLRVYLQATGAEVGNDVDLSGIVDAILVVWTQ
jgi:hypothetical protein